MAKYKYLLFDTDRTLLDFTKAQRAAIEKALTKYGFKVDDEVQDFYTSWNESLWRRLEKREITHDDLVKMRFVVMCSRYGVVYPGYGKIESDYIIALSEGHDLLPGALETIQALKEEYRLYIVTNGIPMVQERRLKESGLIEYVEDAFISEAIGFNKPDIRYFEEVYKRLGEPPKEEILIIGDSMSADIKGGVDFGVDTMLISEHVPEGFDFSPTYVVDNISKVEEYLKKLE